VRRQVHGGHQRASCSDIIADDSERADIPPELDQPELSPRELAVRFTDEAEYFVSEASVYRLLKAHDLITSPAGLHRDQSGRGVQGQDHGA
jgi:hypothetical protein